MVPSNRTVSGITFQVVPASKCVIDTTTAWLASMFLETIDWAALTKLVPMMMASLPC